MVSKLLVTISILLVLSLLVCLYCYESYPNLFTRSSTGNDNYSYTNDISKHDTNPDYAAQLASNANRLSLASFTNFGFSNKDNSDTSNDIVKCGRTFGSGNYNYRIVDGKVATISNFPWIVSIQKERSFWFGFKSYYHSCGGSILTESWIITAAHCLYNNDAKLRVVAGTDNINFLYKAQLRSVVETYSHEDFDIETYNNDIALIKLSTPLNLVSKFSRLAPVCIEPGTPVQTYDIATVAGFGAPAFQKSTQTHLFETDIAIIDIDVCNSSFVGTITENMICAGGMIERKRDACSGDSGGPLSLEVDDHQTMIGIVSFGNDCASQGYPGVYTKVENYYDWIIDYIDESLYQP